MTTAFTPAHHSIQDFLHQNQYIDWVTIISFSGRNEPEVVRKSHSGGQYFLEFEDVIIRIKSELVSLPFGVSMTTRSNCLSSASKDFRRDGSARPCFLLMPLPILTATWMLCRTGRFVLFGKRRMNTAQRPCLDKMAEAPQMSMPTVSACSHSPPQISGCPWM